MRLSEDVIRYLTVKQEGPLPTPRSSSKGSNQSEKKENETIDKKTETSEAPSPEIKETVQS